MKIEYGTQIVDRRFDRDGPETPFVCPACKNANPQQQAVISFERAEMPIDHYFIGCEACGLPYHADVYCPGMDAPPAMTGPARETCPACEGVGTVDPNENEGESCCPLCEGQGDVWAQDVGGTPDTWGQPMLLPPVAP